MLCNTPLTSFCLSAPAATTGDIFTTTQLNRETVSTYFLIIRANDGGTPSLSSTANITVTITDINDNAPQFQGSSEATIIENPLPGSLVSSNFSANDRDEGANAELTWEIVSGNVFEAFRVDPTTGALLVQNASELDYEVTPVFFLELLVKDSGLPLLSSSLLVGVAPTDSSEFTPSLSILTGSRESFGRKRPRPRGVPRSSGHPPRGHAHQ